MFFSAWPLVECVPDERIPETRRPMVECLGSEARTTFAGQSQVGEEWLGPGQRPLFGVWMRAVRLEGVSTWEAK